MKILLDENLTPKSKNILGKYGHDVIHVRDRFIAGKSDEEVFELAQKEERILITLNGKDFIIFIPPVTLKEHYGFIWLRKLHVTNLTYIPIMDKIGMFLSDENIPTKNTYYVVKKRDNEYEIIQQYPKIQFDKYDDSTYKQLQVISQDKQKRLEYEAREKAIRDYNQMMFEAEERGIERGRKEGIEEGRKKEKYNTVKNLIAFGMPASNISQITGLPAEEIEKIYTES